jgi:hypothetical protein
MVGLQQIEKQVLARRENSPEEFDMDSIPGTVQG